jgi:hypothetical protein
MLTIADQSYTDVRPQGKGLHWVRSKGCLRWITKVLHMLHTGLVKRRRMLNCF